MGHLLLLTVITSLMAVHSLAFAEEIRYRSSCPCSNPDYCKRITASDRQEIFAYGLDLTYYKQYDWEKLTSLVIYENSLAKHAMDVICYAHMHNVRVLVATAISEEQLGNATARAKVIDHYYSVGEKYFMDGANIDVEILTKTPELSNGLTSYVKETRDKWKAKYPHSMVATDVWWFPNIYHDTWALANYSDFLFVMSYDEQADMPRPCVGRANAPFAQTQFGLAAFRALGIPGHKLVMGLPWYGYQYECLKLTEHNLCYIKEDGSHCTETVGSELDYRNILQILPHSMGGRQWSDAYKSPFLNYKDSNGTIRQIWFDDVQSLKMKYALAEKYDLRGVGMWHVDALDYANASDPTTKEMWDALPIYK